jgi:hypothetical protein
MPAAEYWVLRFRGGRHGEKLSQDYVIFDAGRASFIGLQIPLKRNDVIVLLIDMSTLICAPRGWSFEEPWGLN